SCWPSRSPSIPKRHATPGVYPRAPRVEPLPDQGADSLDRPTRASHPLAAGSFPVQRSPGGDNDCHLYSVGVAAPRGPLWHGRSPTRRGGQKSPVAAPLSPSQAGRDKPLRPLHFLPKHWARAIVRVGHGRGVVVKREYDKVVITAAYCLPKLPPPDLASYPE